MTEQNWAEGSGSTWESLDGDPRIVPGAEVLVGRHRTIPGHGALSEDWYQPHDEYIGRRLRVREVPGHRGAALVADLNTGGRVEGYFRVRDLVCLKTADGRLTDEGLALVTWGGMTLEARKAGQWSAGGAQRVPVIDWAIRAGIMVAYSGSYKLDLERLDMALGGKTEVEPHCATCTNRMVPSESEPCRACCAAPSEHGRIVYPGWRPVTGAQVESAIQELNRAETHRHYCHECADVNTSTEQYPCVACRDHSLWSVPKANAVEEPTYYPSKEGVEVPLLKPRVCVGCGRPLDPSRDKFDVYGRCSDCGFVTAGGEISLRELGIDPRKIEDTSGEAWLDDLRRFVAGPCGRPK